MTNNTQNQTPEENGSVDNAKWLKANKAVVAAVVITAIVVGGIFAIIDNLRDKSYQDQWSNLFMAEMAVANGGDPSAYAPLEDFANKYKTKPAGVYANFVLATALAQQGEFLKAEVFYKQALEYANDEFGAMITNSLIANVLEQGDYDRAVTLADDFVAKNPTHFSVPQVKLYKALGLELAGKTEEAKEVFKSLEEDYPQTYYAAIATAKLAPAEEKAQQTEKKAKKK